MVGDEDSRSEQIDHAIVRYLQAVETGDASSREKVQIEYPDLASQLSEFLTQQASVTLAVCDSPVTPEPKREPTVG
jgi:hypothetical protein